MEVGEQNYWLHITDSWVIQEARERSPCDKVAKPARVLMNLQSCRLFQDLHVGRKCLH